MEQPSPTKEHHYTSCDRLFRYAEFLNFGEIHVKFDHATGLRAIVAIHNLTRGPAIGGCRFVPYVNTDDAIEDALRLSQMMSLKAAISNLPHGGAKTVIMQPKVIKDRTALFKAYGDFVNELNGRYVTATDSGTEPSDMDVIATRTPHVTCTSRYNNSGEPTSSGVVRGIEAAVKFKLGKDKLSNVHVAIQGGGHVGYYLAKELAAKGAKLTACDINLNTANRLAKEFGVTIVPPDAIYDVEADVFAPCALGAILNLQTIKRLRVPIVAGSANNQLAHHHQGVILHEQGILYAPDFVINAGGLIYVAAIYDHADDARAKTQIGSIYDTLMEIFSRSQKENLATNEIAERIALERLKS